MLNEFHAFISSLKHKDHKPNHNLTHEKAIKPPDRAVYCIGRFFANIISKRYCSWYQRKEKSQKRSCLHSPQTRFCTGKICTNGLWRLFYHLKFESRQLYPHGFKSTVRRLYWSYRIKWKRGKGSWKDLDYSCGQVTCRSDNPAKPGGYN